MFNFFYKNKKIHANQIKEFEWAIKAINVYIALSEWNNAKKGIEEILKKEKESLDELIEIINKEEESVFSERQKDEEKIKYKIKERKILKIKNIIENKENKYIKKIENERFQIRFKKIRYEINNLIWTKKTLEAMELLQQFIEENKEKSIVIKFYNTEKNRIQKFNEKQRKEEQVKIKQNTRNEALNLIWETININDDKIKDKEKKSFFTILKRKLNFYNILKEKIKKKRLLDEISLLIEEDSKIKNELAEKKLENIHKWLVKELNKNELIGYNLYGKILWANKISGDAFWIEEDKNRYLYFIWDATWHWIKAWFIITLLSRFFRENLTKTLKEIVFAINNWLKQDLKSRNFITSVLFEINKESKKISYIWMWHEKLLLYRKKTDNVEQIIPWGLAAWIRIIKNIQDIKSKELNLEDWDILMTYSDWIIENKSPDWNFYWIEKLEEAFKLIAKNESDIKNIYNYIINDIKLFRWSINFDDDATVILLKRNSLNDIINEWDKYIDELKTKEWIANSDIKNLKWKTKQEIQKELVNIKRKKETQRILKNLEHLYYTWEVLKLKEEAIRFIKKWFIHKKINYYLKKAIENENKYKVEQKNQRIQIKYTILQDLYKKWDFITVINEVEDIIAKDWNI